MILILGPILLFSGLNPIMVKNPVQEGLIELSLEMNSNGNCYSILETQGFNFQTLSLDDTNSLYLYFAPTVLQFNAEEM